MHNIYARFVLGYLLFLPFLPAFFLAIVVNVKIAKTNIGFLPLFFRIFANVITFFFAENILNMRKIFFFLFFLDNSIDTSYMGVIATILFLFTIMSKISLVILILFIGLVGRRLLFSAKYINRGGISKFIFSRVFIFFFGQLVVMEQLGINLLYIR